jgi:hypothetical protein
VIGYPGSAYAVVPEYLNRLTWYDTGVGEQDHEMLADVEFIEVVCKPEIT